MVWLSVVGALFASAVLVAVAARFYFAACRTIDECEELLDTVRGTQDFTAAMLERLDFDQWEDQL